MERSRQVDPLVEGGRARVSAEAAARQAALRGATLLVLVSIVMAGAPVEQAKAAAAAPTTHREARLVAASELTASASIDEQGEEEWGAAAPGGSVEVEVRAEGGGAVPAGRGGCIRALVRVALLDLPPPLTM